MSIVAWYLLIGAIYALLSTIVDFLVYGKQFNDLLVEYCGPSPWVQVLYLMIAMVIIAVTWPWCIARTIARWSK